jgi:hypothetical protein
MTEVKESRVIRIQDKIVTLRDVRALATLVANEVTTDDAGTAHWSGASFDVDTIDNSSFQSSDPELFSDDSPITRRRAMKIEMSFRASHQNKRISICLEHGGATYRNMVSVSGTDSKWVNGTTAQIESVVTAMKPQGTFFSKWGSAFGIVSAVSVGAIITWVMTKALLFVPLHTSTEPNGVFLQILTYVASTPIGNLFVKYAMYYFAGLFPGYALIGKLRSLWPSIELQIGPEHVQVEKQRRIWAANFVVLGVLPLLVSFVYDILRSFGG